MLKIDRAPPPPPARAAIPASASAGPAASTQGAALPSGKARPVRKRKRRAIFQPQPFVAAAAATKAQGAAASSFSKLTQDEKKELALLVAFKCCGSVRQVERQLGIKNAQGTRLGYYINTVWRTLEGGLDSEAAVTAKDKYLEKWQKTHPYLFGLAPADSRCTRIPCSASRIKRRKLPQQGIWSRRPCWCEWDKRRLRR